MPSVAVNESNTLDNPILGVVGVAGPLGHPVERASAAIKPATIQEYVRNPLAQRFMVEFSSIVVMSPSLRRAYGAYRKFADV